MKIGDLVKDKRDGELGIIVGKTQGVTFLEVYWASGGSNMVQRNWLEVLNEDR